MQKLSGISESISEPIASLCFSLPSTLWTPSAYALEHTLLKIALYLPKRLFTIVVPDDAVTKGVKLIIKIKQTERHGNGKILVSPIEDSVRVRTGEHDNKPMLLKMVVFNTSNMEFRKLNTLRGEDCKVWSTDGKSLTAVIPHDILRYEKNTYQKEKQNKRSSSAMGRK